MAGGAESFESLLGEGARLVEEGDYRRARQLLSQAHMRRPTDPSARYWLALAHMNLGKVGEARELLEKLREQDLEPLSARPAAVWEALCRCWTTSDTEKAVTYGLEGIRRDPDDPRMRFVAAAALTRAGRKQEALTHYRQAWRLEREEDDRPAFRKHPGMVPYSLSTVLVEMKRWKEARAAVEAAVEREPEHALYHNRLGVILFEGFGETEAAAAAAREAVRLDPQTRTHGLDGLYWSNLAIYLKSLERWREAIEAIEQAIRISPRASYKALLAELQGAAATEPFPAVVPAGGGAEAGPALDWSKVGGMGALKEQVRRILRVVHTDREEARRYGIERNGILFHGPPGCGKTFFAEATAGEFDLTFLRVPLGRAQSKYVGGAAEGIERVFREAKERTPCLLFFDELDAVAARRDEAGTGHEQQMVNALLQQIDEHRSIPGLVLAAATNRLDAIDPAAVREGRFDYKVAIGKPDFDARREILQVLLAERPHEEQLDVTPLAQEMEGTSAAQVRHVVDEAAMDALEAGVSIAESHLRAAWHRHITSRKYSGKRLGWDDLILPAATKRRLQLVERLMENPELARRLGVAPPTGLLLHGPPGTGKTTIARVLASETDASFYAVNASDIFTRWLGASEKKVKDLFQKARDSVPAIVFIDEVEAVLGTRSVASSGAGHARNSVVNTFLAEMDGIEDNGRIFVVAATNRPELLDEAAVRPGRLSEAVEIGLPDEECRRHLLELFSRDMPLTGEVDLEELAASTEGASGADLEGLCAAAGRAAFLRELDEQDDEHVILPQDFEHALQEIFPDQSWQDDRKIGFHT